MCNKHLFQSLDKSHKLRDDHKELLRLINDTDQFESLYQSISSK
jgi:hypothetical protein